MDDGRWSTEKCPRCGATLLTNDLWCSFVGGAGRAACAFGVAGEDGDPTVARGRDPRGLAVGRGGTMSATTIEWTDYSLNPGIGSPGGSERRGPACPGCSGPLEAIEYPGGALNREQWASIRAGDFACRTCPERPDPARQSNAGLCYWTRAEVDAVDLAGRLDCRP